MMAEIANIMVERIDFDATKHNSNFPTSGF